MATTTTSDKARLGDVIDAMREVQTESDRWILAESLRKLIPSGTNGFDKVIDEATAKGVVGSLSAHTLRLYRDTASRWPAKSRIPGVSFSAHREAMVMIAADGNTGKAEKLLNDLAKKGADKVTVAQVRRAAAIQQGKNPPAPRGGKNAPAAGFDVLQDVSSGAAKLIAAINATEPSQLDKIHAGLSKALQRVEQLRAKAQRAAKKSPSSTPVKPVAAKQTPPKNGTGKPAASKRGDLRDL